jgi:rubrerythrin
MSNVSLTTAAIISFSERLEDSSSAFYEEMAERFAENREQLLDFAKEGRKNKIQVVRTYQETITDALEACFSFEGLDLSDYQVETTLPTGVGYSEAVELAIALEEKACQFYLDVAERSKSLLATIPGAFKRVAKKREKRKLKLQSMLD